MSKANGGSGRKRRRRPPDPRQEAVTVDLNEKERKVRIAYFDPAKREWTYVPMPYEIAVQLAVGIIQVIRDADPSFRAALGTYEDFVEKQIRDELEENEDE